MDKSTTNINIKKELFAYFLVTLFTLLILAWILELWKADIRIPFTYYWDAIYNSAFIKGVIDNGLHIYNLRIGAPTGLFPFDFQDASAFYILLIHLSTIFTKNYAVVINVLFLISFPLASVSSFFVFRYFKLSYLASAVGSLLFAFTPFHFIRGETGLFLSFYFQIPLITIISLWITSKDPFFLIKERGGQTRIKIDFRTFFSIVVCLIIATTGVYYSFFSIFLLIVAAIFAFFKSNRRHVLVAFLLIAIILIGLVTNLFPSITYQLKNGPNKEVAQRTQGEIETYGLKISQLLLPITNHRISFLAEIKDKYNKSAPLVGENDSSSLGIIAGLGFLFLIFVGIFKAPLVKDTVDKKAEVIKSLSIFNLTTVLLASIGGFSSFIALFFTKIRTYNRISPFITFFSLFAIAIVLDGLHKRIRINKLWFYFLLIVMLILGVLDQTSKTYVPAYKQIKDIVKSQKDFIFEIEKIVPANSSIFQLPYIQFPEPVRTFSITGYEHLTAYLQSSKLNFSYGAIKGRRTDKWQRIVTSYTTENFVKAISFAGFNGIYIDRYGFEDRGDNITAELQNILAIKPIVSRNGRYIFFSLIDYKKQLEQVYSKSQLLINKHKALNPLVVRWKKGFYGPELNQNENWRWSSAKSAFTIENKSKYKRTAFLSMSFKTAFDNFSDLIVKTKDKNKTLRIDSSETPPPFQTKIALNPYEKYRVNFFSKGKMWNVPTEKRKLFFRIYKFSLEELY